LTKGPEDADGGEIPFVENRSVALPSIRVGVSCANVPSDMDVCGRKKFLKSANRWKDCRCGTFSLVDKLRASTWMRLQVVAATRSKDTNGGGKAKAVSQQCKFSGPVGIRM